MDINVILNLVTVAVLALGGYLAKVGKDALAAGVEQSAREGAKAAIKAIDWPRELARELEKVRGTERQELRFESYGALWERLRPFAVYDQTVPDPAMTRTLSKDLSDWYFSKCGGLMLTAQTRNFYFALQDLLHSLGAASWTAERSPGDQREVFLGIIERENVRPLRQTLDELNRDDFSWSSVSTAFGKEWREHVVTLTKRWNSLTPTEHFAVLQQVSSALRTAMVNDVESRLR